MYSIYHSRFGGYCWHRNTANGVVFSSGYFKTLKEASDDLLDLFIHGRYTE